MNEWGGGEGIEPFAFTLDQRPTPLAVRGKRCTHCDMMKPATPVYFYPKGEGKLHSWCKECLKGKRQAENIHKRIARLYALERRYREERLCLEQQLNAPLVEQWRIRMGKDGYEQ